MVPFSILAIIVLLCVFIVWYRIEKIAHIRRLRTISTRIWVNGTRGKSSVTRLIAAGLRTRGKHIIAKTTGTSPRFIIANNSETPVVRLGMANIREQIRIVKESLPYKPDVIVLECMALRPDLQQIESLHIVKPNIVVITNVRSDHLDVMGPTVNDVAHAFINAIPINCTLFTTESSVAEQYHQILRKKNVEVHISDCRSVSDDMLDKFSYIEHKENVALALDVCKYSGVDTDTALSGMIDANPDPGVLRKHVLVLNGKKVTLVDAMAANDPDSTYHIWQQIDKEYAQINLLINCRDDRIDRSFQIATLIQHRIRDADNYIITGKGTDVLAKQLERFIERKKLLNLGGKTVRQAVNDISSFVSDNSLICAIGNTVGYGQDMVNEFLNRKEHNVN